MIYKRTKRSERVRAEARDKILRAAAKLFVQKGYDDTTMQDIVKAARTSIGNVYFYFDNKEALAWTLLEEAATSAWAWTDEAVADVPPGPARLAVMVMANTTTLLGANAGLTRILLLAATTKTLRERVAARFAARIRSYILANVPSFPAERVDIAVSAWLGAARNCIEQRLVGALHGEPEELAAFVVRWNLRGLGVADDEIDEAIDVASKVVARWNERGGGRVAPANVLSAVR
ncbi:MAG TPA: helix-turn-helix domain-containing protein [Gemmatimonadaceae bacterium]|jgi:AcrR family transcriptional regulator